MKRVILFIIIVLSTNINAQTPGRPFPNHTNYTANHIKPNNYSQIQLDTQTQLFYDEWKSEYLKNDCGNTSEYYVFSGNGAKNISEAQGYGMMITAFFAGYDTDAQMLFDGLYQFYKLHPSIINNNLMDWQQVSCNDAQSSDDDSASDGDIDIAFALLLAHIQWGSNGLINYLLEAKIITNAIMQDEINQNIWSIKLGDWSNANDPDYFYGTRSSDFITDHFKAFSCFNNNWNNVIDICYSLIGNMQNSYSPTTGLIPDFIINLNINPIPAGVNYLEANTDGDYSYNACRVPWRLGTDYLINGDLRAKTAISKINTWLVSATNGNIASISNGYALNGTAQFSWNDATFIGPFTVGAMLDISNQTWLNNLYDELVLNNNLADGDYYSNTIKLLSMITISGNYWVPDCDNLDISLIKKEEDNILIYPNRAKDIVHIDFVLNTKNATYTITDINGKLLNKGVLQDTRNTINIASYNSGMYFISVIIDDEIITKKMIKL